MAQDSIKGDLMFCAGVSRSFLYNQSFNGYPSGSDPFVYKVKSPTTQLDLAVVYLFESEYKGLKPLIGASYQSLGFIESGVFMGDTSSFNYRYAHITHYGSIFLGAQYTLFKGKKLKINWMQTFLPMINSDKIWNMKKVGFSTRALIPFDYAFKKERHLFVIPFFQTNLSKYNTNKVENKGANYLPFSYGLQLGAYFKR